MKKYIPITLCLMFFTMSVYAITCYWTHDYYWNSQREYVNYGLTQEGTPKSEASWLIVTYRYNITDSRGKTHTLVVGRSIYAREQGKWKYQTGWWLDYKKIEKFRNKHSSN